MTHTSTQSSIRLGLMSAGNIMVGIDVNCVAEVCPIRHVSRLLAEAPGLLGAIELRGDPIPLLDPRPLAGLPQEGADPGIAVIAARDGRRVALGFDAIEGLIQIPSDKVQRFETSGTSIFAGTVEHRGRIISILDPRAVLSRHDIPIAANAAAMDADDVISAARSFLIFDSGRARFGIAATSVEATVPRQEIDRHGLANGAWLGMIRHHGRRVPVMHLNDVLGIGDINDLCTAEVVIVRFPGDRLIGFAVEAIQRMQMVPSRNARALPEMLALQTLGVESVLSDANEVDTFLIDLDALQSNGVLEGMAGLSDEDPPHGQPAADARPGGIDGGAYERDRYLVARSGAPVAIPIRQIARIVKTVDNITPLARAPSWVRGVFRGDNGTVPLIDLAGLLGHGQTAVTDRSRILLAGDRDAPTGFAVESVDHLEWSNWRSAEASAEGVIHGLVSLPRLAGRGVLPVVDLDSVVAKTSRGLELAGS